ncbi:aldo/keto reductase family protein [Kribbibacterium absianum]|nr:aldo/keto reductase [Olsenella sp. YH-ols2216]
MKCNEPVTQTDNLSSLTFTLNSGREMPAIGYGTWLTPDGDCPALVEQAAKDGYRLFDTAQVYENEAGVGNGVRHALDQLRLERGDVFVTTKVDADFKQQVLAYNSIHLSLDKLQMPYADLVLIHAPRPWKYMDEDPDTCGHFYDENRAVWLALEDAVKTGWTRSIGLSQFSVDDMEHLLADGATVPAVLQTCAYIGNMPWDLMEYCSDKGIQLQAFCPLGHGNVLKNDDLAAMATKYQVSTAQLCLRYLLQKGFAVIPKTVVPAHLQQNLELGFAIEDADVAALDKLNLKDAIKGL